MAWVVFLRGVNLGGKRFSPAALAKELGKLDARSIGAAGTFVVRGSTTAAALRRAVQARLPFESDVVVCKGRALQELVARDPFARALVDAKPFLTVLAAAPRKRPRLPLERPEGPGWQVRVVRVEGPFVLSVRRNVQGKFYPNEVVERELGVRATTRGWPTILKVANALADPDPTSAPVKARRRRSNRGT